MLDIKPFVFSKDPPKVTRYKLRNMVLYSEPDGFTSVVIYGKECCQFDKNGKKKVLSATQLNDLKKAKGVVIVALNKINN